MKTICVICMQRSGKQHDDNCPLNGTVNHNPPKESDYQ